MDRKDKVIALLAAVGAADTAYLKLYQERIIDHLWCPLTDGCEKVVRSPEARTLGISHTTAGLVGYAAIGALALSGNRSRGARAALGTMAAGAAVVSAYLAYKQKAKVGAWCSLCLASAAINWAIAGLVGPEAIRAARRAPTDSR